MDAAAAERAELRDLLADLDDAEWSVPSLCEGWSVRDVAAHVVAYEGLGPRELAGLFVRGRTLAGVNRAALARHDGLGRESILERYDRWPRPAGLTAARGGAVGLVDCLIHAQDVRRPLGRPRSIDPDRLALALRFAVTAPPLRGLWHVRGVRVVADDLDFAHGRGPEATGPGEAVLMVLAGRRGVARELTGPGAARLAARSGGPGRSQG